ncbi:hypothetical protein BW243_03545 [Leptospira interrogans serovar Pomona]|nr:hypothetical protein BW243_03545 [Leptospira interrogans serovar Pomona]
MYFLIVPTNFQSLTSKSTICMSSHIYFFYEKMNFLYREYLLTLMDKKQKKIKFSINLIFKNL